MGEREQRMLFNLQYLLFMAPAFLLMLATSWYVKSAYQKWGRVPARSQLTGIEAAQRLIARGGLYGIQIQNVAGNLTDNYDPRTKILHLSQGVALNLSLIPIC